MAWKIFPLPLIREFHSNKLVPHFGFVCLFVFYNSQWSSGLTLGSALRVQFWYVFGWGSSGVRKLNLDRCIQDKYPTCHNTSLTPNYILGCDYSCGWVRCQVFGDPCPSPSIWNSHYPPNTCEYEVKFCPNNFISVYFNSVVYLSVCFLHLSMLMDPGRFFDCVYMWHQGLKPAAYQTYPFYYLSGPRKS